MVMPSRDPFWSMILENVLHNPVRDLLLRTHCSIQRLLTTTSIGTTRSAIRSILASIPCAGTALITIIIVGEQFLEVSLREAARVVDEQQVVRHFTERDLKELFSYDDDGDEGSAGTGNAGKDASDGAAGGANAGGGEKTLNGAMRAEEQIADGIMKNILKDHRPKWVSRWHNHEPMVREVEHTLTQEEQETALRSYQDAEDRETMENVRISSMNNIYQPGQFILIGGVSKPGGAGPISGGASGGGNNFAGGFGKANGFGKIP
eukprot:TRINITY_DN79478_c0_g1_i1.p2 TRINITY_DN79478_c0_g1~~TRINITY_DN79478_c0_g1_i1.p2  ORF type:complete len:263 (-),score=29.20 TRINITY_DN79478_c0_g1_i1:9-797(-)